MILLLLLLMVDMLLAPCCRKDTNLSRKAAPYLFPCTIEYSLISAAVVYKMYRHLRGTTRQQLHITHDDLIASSAINVDCHKVVGTL